MKKGISPLIASVLLIGFTIIMAVLIFAWTQRSFFVFEKKDISCNQEANLICENNIKFELGPLNGNKVEVKNTGSFAIKGFNEKPVNRIELTPPLEPYTSYTITINNPSSEIAPFIEHKKTPVDICEIVCTKLYKKITIP